MWFHAIVFVVLFCGAQSVSKNAEKCLVNFDQAASGEGLLRETFENSSYCAFLGVRYAEPPVGDRRFRHSVLAKPRGQRKYTAFGNRCPQFSWFVDQKVNGDEDCLFLNIYTPMVSNSSLDDDVPLYPVLVFVHGGSYALGWAERDINGVHLLVDNGILVVTFNYRLYGLGFLNSPEHNITGNFGLKDQTTLLRWVQRYIRHFGGDPQQVTLAGQSAGAGSVTHHLYIEQSRDLFHRMIALSGSMLGSWSFLYDGRECIQRYLDDLPSNTLEQLRAIDFRDFFPGNSWENYSVYFASMYMPCLIPSPEDEQLQQDNYTVRPPHESILQAPVTQVPMLISVTSLEFDGLLENISSEFFLGDNRPNNQNDTVTNLVNATMHRFAEKLIAEGKATSRSEVFQRFANLADLHYPIFRLAKDLSETVDPSIPVYYQRFEFDGKFGKGRNVYYANYIAAYNYGALHGDDLGYIFSPYNLEDALERPQDFQKEWKVHRRTVELIVNFIKHGNPTPSQSKLSDISWPPLNDKKTPNLYLNIDEDFEIRPISYDIYSKQWEKFYDCLYYDRCDALES
ncbi:juvenile hormone esterase-like [Anopheles ziemanni]|uniref:juvenile hormone esterase-like n=1 Tax=Anopheles coustani TaxID=139045 RepID=UPI002657CE69|nr:juvenile hormone esterase-like [Anopheles coustani]XP_058170149.1 juvenile hormone esterase-like [Anopheles ziemanni]